MSIPLNTTVDPRNITIAFSSYGNHYKRIRSSLRHSQDAVENKMLRFDVEHDVTEEDSWAQEAFEELRSTRNFYIKLLADLEAQYKAQQPSGDYLD